jgi:acyl-CoA synthetase (AMP-forming)/AMP-acid ligase II/acyl carrier protein
MTQSLSEHCVARAEGAVAALPSQTVPGRVLAHAAARPDAACYFFHNSAGPPDVLSFEDLVARAAHVAGILTAAGCSNGARVALIFEHGPGFVIALFGAFFAGCAAVPVAVPTNETKRTRAGAILAEADCAVLLTSPAIAKTFAEDGIGIAALPPVIALDTVDRAASVIPDRIVPEDVAIIQYTSGSTGHPRGVVVTHGALHAQMCAIDLCLQSEGEERVVTWLPPEHDMGLMGGLLFNLWRGDSTYVIAPESFIRRPYLWLDTISKWRGTVSVAPNFAFDLCVRGIPADRLKSLDLSSWRVALNGAEPVQPETLARFADAFKPVGFDPQCFLPCYGLAEATLLVSGAARGGGATTHWFDPEALDSGRVVPMAAGTGRCLVSSGPVRTTGGVRIVEPETGVPCRSDRIGEIWIAGESVGSGYHDRPEDSDSTFGQFTATGDGPYLRSGDLGFLWNDELYVTGRIKDIVLWRGRTLHAADLELLITGADPAIRPGRIAAYQRDAGNVDLVVEIAQGRLGADGGTGVAERIWRDLMAGSGVDVARVRLARPGTLMWTSSGKLRRRDTHARLETESELVVLDWEPGPLRARRAQIEATRTLAGALAQKSAGPGAYLRFLTDWVAAAINCAPQDVDPHLPWADQGMDSLMITEMVVDLEQAVGRDIQPELLFEIPTPSGLALALAQGSS